MDQIGDRRWALEAASRKHSVGEGSISGEV